MMKKHKTLIVINIPQNMAELSGLFSNRCRKILNVIGAQRPIKLKTLIYLHIFFKMTMLNLFVLPENKKNNAELLLNKVPRKFF